MTISFKEFLGLSKEEQMHLSTTLSEELSPSLKKKKMRELERILKKMDFFYQYIDGDYKEWKKYHEMAQDIRKLEDLIGDDAVQLHRQYAAKVNYDFKTMEHKDTQTPVPAKVNEVKQRKSLFPEMDNVERNISLGVDVNENGYVLPDGGHHFTSGNPYENADKWYAPSPQRKRGWQDK
tara:strand:+ start:772 stop:1308 length:537 start_codon:yes stop_codon:yes gene_type:complete